MTIDKPQPSPRTLPVGRALQALSERFARAVGRFPVALALTLAATVLFICVDVAPKPFEGMMRVALGALAAFPATVVVRLAAERGAGRAGQGSLSDEAAPLRDVPWQVAVGLVVALVVAGTERLYGSDYTLWQMLFLATFVVPFFLGLWLLYTKGNEVALMPVVLSGLLFAMLFAAVLTIGFLAVHGAFTSLVYDPPVDLFSSIIYLCWTFAFPMAFLSQVPEHDEEIEAPRLWRVIVGHAVFVLCLLLLAVLYLYLARIAITRTMPSGEMNWYGSFALLVYLGLWAGMRMMGNAPSRWFVRWGWALLIPVVVVQLYGVYLRLAAYGLTPLRYASLGCTLVGLVGLGLAAAGRGPRPLCLVAALMALVVLVSPANALDMAYLHQARCLSDALEQRQGGAEVPEGDHERVTGAWEYLRQADRGFLRDDALDDAVARMDTDKAFEEALGFAPDRYYPEMDGGNRYLWASAEPAPLDVSGYSTVWPLELCLGDCRVSDDGTVSATLSAGTTTVREVDLTEVVGQMVEGSLPGEPVDEFGWQLPRQGIAIDLEDGSRVLVTELYVDVEDGRAMSVSVGGYLLQP